MTETLLGGGLRLVVSSNRYDNAGRLAATVDAQGIVTSYISSGLTNSTIRGGLTNTTVRYLDGSPKTVAANGAVGTSYDYGVNTGGSCWTKVFNGPAGLNSLSWQKTTVDPLGRTVLSEKPAFGGGVVSSAWYFNDRNQLVRATPSGSVPVLYEYNELGGQYRSAFDVNTNGVIDLAGPDHVAESAAWFEKDAGQQYRGCRASLTYATTGVAAPVTNGVNRLLLWGEALPSNGLVTEIQSRDLLGNTTISRTFIDRSAKTVCQLVSHPGSTNNAEQVSINGLTVTNRSVSSVVSVFTYDGLGRQVSALTPAPRTVGAFTTYNSLGQVASTMDAASNITSFTYDSLGRRIAVTDALSNTTWTAYDVENRVVATWGATYPVAYEYDDIGRMTAMYTYRGSNALSSYSEICGQKSQMDRTTWLYDQATGLLTNKLYSDSRGPAYTYTPDGKLASRTWARGVVTTYSYNPLGLLSSVSYSDNTPAVTFSYDRLGRQATITDGQGTRVFAYNDALQLASETNTLAALVRSYDQFGRAAGYDLSLGGMTSVSSVRYGYDPLGRFSVVTSTVASVASVATYSYLPGSDLVAGYTNDSGFSLMRSYEPNRNLIAQILNTSGTNLVSRFDYFNDAIGRRTRRFDSLGSLPLPLTNAFFYNSRSELEDAAMGTNSYSYRYDPIGNRTVATNNAEAFSYAANSLNQYTNISASSVTSAPSYDLNGNLTNDGRFACSWDAENRMTGASNASTTADYSYDYMSRRFRKIVNGVTNSFVYDGWNVISEISSVGVTNIYTWGPDLSGTQQGAGGIGGLLSVTRNGVTYYPCYDANGNITDYVAGNGTVVAHREYDPYGNTVTATGPMVNDFNYWFSTKYLDHETGLYYYGYRFCAPEIGRWASRDPMGEKIRSYVSLVSKKLLYDLSYSEANLYLSLANDGENIVDPDGRSILPPLPPSYQVACLATVLGIALGEKTINGDWRHCYVSCQGGKLCGPITDVDALLYELLQLMGGALGSSGDLDELKKELAEFLNDMKANLYGQKCSGDYTSSCDCCCSKKYPK